MNHKEILYYLSIKQYSTTRVAAIRGQTGRNIRKLRTTIHKKIRRENKTRPRKKKAALDDSQDDG